MRGHAAWAIGQIGDAQGAQALKMAANREADPEAQREIDAALKALGRSEGSHTPPGECAGYLGYAHVDDSAARDEVRTVLVGSSVDSPLEDVRHDDATQLLAAGDFGDQPVEHYSGWLALAKPIDARLGRPVASTMPS